MRAYFFVNSALSGIQKGLQVAHCVAEINEKYRKKGIFTGKDAKHWNTYNDWATDHKTIIVLEGGFHQDLLDLAAFMETAKESIAWSFFSEDNQTMNGMMTCVGIIVQEPIYTLAETIRKRTETEESIARIKKSFSSWELAFIDWLNSCPLAR